MYLACAGGHVQIRIASAASMQVSLLIILSSCYPDRSGRYKFGGHPFRGRAAHRTRVNDYTEGHGRTVHTQR